MSDGLLVVANAAAGSAGRDSVEAARAVLARGGPVEVVTTGSVVELDAALDRRDGRTLVVAGGDGSLHVVVQRLLERDELADATLGLVPLGTGNDLARGLGLPLEPAEAAEAVLAGRPHALDLLVDDAGGVVVNGAHAGLGAEASDLAASLKGRLGPLAYPLGALVAGVREGGWDLTVLVDDEPVAADRMLMVGVANGPSIGGGTLLAPEARPDDGLADVVVVTAVGPLARAAFATALRDGSSAERDDVAHFRGRRVAITGDPVRHNADGEVSEEVTSRTYALRSGAWRLLVPPDDARRPTEPERTEPEREEER